MSELKSEPARTNGAKSNGPITPAGKAISARNSLRHGLRAKAVVLPSESQEEFAALREAYFERFQPADAVEAGLVESLAAARWRLLRVATIETHLLASEMEDVYQPPGVTLDDDQRLAGAFRRGQDSLTALARYESSLNRAFDRALRQLQLLQKAHPAPAPGFVRQILKPAPPETPSAPAYEPANSPSAPVADSTDQPPPSAPCSS